MSKQTETNGFLDWIKRHSVLLLVTLGVILIVLTQKTQTVILTDTATKTNTVQLKYSVFGYCVSVYPEKETQAIAADHVFVLGGMDDTTLKAARWIADKTDSGIAVKVSGYPKNNETLTDHLCQLLADNGITAAELEVNG